MTYDIEQFLLQEMDRDDLMEIQDFGTFKEVVDTTMGFDESYNIIDEDAGLIFPQEFREYDEERS